VPILCQEETLAASRKAQVPLGILRRVKSAAIEWKISEPDSDAMRVAVIATPHATRCMCLAKSLWDADQRIVGDGDVGRQLNKSLENLAVVLASVGAKLDQIGSLRLYIKQSHLREGEAISNALKAAFGGKPPCAAWIGVPVSLELNSLSKWNRP
jgi:hypothetical protein